MLKPLPPTLRLHETQAKRRRKSEEGSDFTKGGDMISLRLGRLGEGDT